LSNFKQNWSFLPKTDHILPKQDQ